MREIFPQIMFFVSCPLSTLPSPFDYVKECINIFYLKREFSELESLELMFHLMHASLDLLSCCYGEYHFHLFVESVEYFSYSIFNSLSLLWDFCFSPFKHNFRYFFHPRRGHHNSTRIWTESAQARILEEDLQWRLWRHTPGESGDPREAGLHGFDRLHRFHRFGHKLRFEFQKVERNQSGCCPGGTEVKSCQYRSTKSAGTRLSSLLVTMEMCRMAILTACESYQAEITDCVLTGCIAFPFWGLFAFVN